jgi:hypothetical protein
MLSVTVVLAAVFGPLFWVRIVYVTVDPGVAVAGPVLLVAISALPATVVMTVVVTVDAG